MKIEYEGLLYQLTNRLPSANQDSPDCSYLPNQLPGVKYFQSLIRPAEKRSYFEIIIPLSKSESIQINQNLFNRCTIFRYFAGWLFFYTNFHQT